jgi:hypothetical protein
MTHSRRIGYSLLTLAGLLLAVGAWAAAAACSSGGGGKLKPDTAVGDGISFDWSFGDLPPGCPPAAGNEKNVGKPCSVGGKECPGGMICACEEFAGITPPAGTPCFCTVAILGKQCSDATVPPDYCGTGASCCGYMNQGFICVPDACLTSMMCPSLQ